MPPGGTAPRARGTGAVGALRAANPPAPAPGELP